MSNDSLTSISKRAADRARRAARRARGTDAPADGAAPGGRVDLAASPVRFEPSADVPPRGDLADARSRRGPDGNAPGDRPDVILPPSRIRDDVPSGRADVPEIPLQSANVWWSIGLGRVPPGWEPSSASAPPEDPEVRLAAVLAILGLVFAPFGLAAWVAATHELRRIRRNVVTDRGRGFLVLAQVVGAIVTLVATATLVANVPR
jgi:hypothetical protein